jgi:drug/metabolite transporter (DMT)-like permease
MPLHVTLAVLSAALFHAIWNSLIKGGKDTLLDSMLISAVWVVIALTAFRFVPFPARESWPIIALSVVIHVGYFFLLAHSYRTGELSRVYPIVRGLPPLIVTLVSALWLHEPMHPYGWLGVATICAGILALEAGNKTPSPHALFLSFGTALMIAIYTLLDGIGARMSGNSTSFLLWLTFFQSIIFNALVLRFRSRSECITHAKTHWKRGIIGGILSLGGYGIVLWAITKAPIPYVSALRETSVLFASVIAVVFLSEPLRISRLISAVLILGGILLMKMTP